MHLPGGFCLAAAEEFEAGSLKAAQIYELPNSQPTCSQVSPLKILIPYLQVILSAPPVLKNTGPGLSFGPKAICSWLPSCEIAFGRGASPGHCGCCSPEHYRNLCMCFFRSQCLK